MKNLHLIATDKPSILSFVKDKLVLFNTEGEGSMTHHIYITNDEEIKEGDWYLDTFNTQIIKANQFSDHKHYGNACKKIILTTDQDLISDGVQAIDDEFLEWFVKNPSCEEVEVFKERYHGVEFIDDYPKGFFDYKIIIPQEELNLNCFDCNKSLQDCTCIEDTINMKQETLEEAKQRVLKANYMSANDADIFEMGTKWQQERMYSEEEAGELVYNIIGEYAKQYGIMIDGAKLNDLFEQFKKK